MNKQITIMGEEARRKRIKLNFPHIRDELFNKNIYANISEGLKEIIDNVALGGSAIIFLDTREKSEKAPYSRNQWLAVFVSRINGKHVTIPIVEGDDFLELQTAHPSSGEQVHTYNYLYYNKPNNHR